MSAIPAASRRLLARLAVSALAVLVALGACAKKGPPMGGPPDLDPPSLVASAPDSGAQGVARDVHPSLTFSEGMDPRSTADAISIVPTVDILERRWSRRTLTIVPAESLRADQTYTLFLGRGPRDRHGNPLPGGTAIVFTTAAVMPAGRIDGTMVARGFTAAGTYLWCYDEARMPDSTARDFNAVGLADRDGHFRVVGLKTPGRYRLWAFADLNGNRSFEPSSDVLSPVDTTFALTSEQPAATGFVTTVVNPRATGSVAGAVLDSLDGEPGTLQVIAVAIEDSVRRVTVQADREGHYQMALAPGAWRLRAWRDLDRDKTWRRDREPASRERRVDVTPAAEIAGVDLVLESAAGEP